MKPTLAKDVVNPVKPEDLIGLFYLVRTNGELTMDVYHFGVQPKSSKVKDIATAEMLLRNYELKAPWVHRLKDRQEKHYG